MREFKPTRYQISGNGDIELLDYALDNVGAGHVERRFRLLNIKRWQYLQLTFTRGGKRSLWQPFRPEFVKDASDGSYTVSYTGNSPYITEAIITQAGFTIIKTTPGDYPDMGRSSAGMLMTSSATLNGRNLSIRIDTRKDTAVETSAQAGNGDGATPAK
jgi:hypothetical protein